MKLASFKYKSQKTCDETEECFINSLQTKPDVLLTPSNVVVCHARVNCFILFAQSFIDWNKVRELTSHSNGPESINVWCFNWEACACVRSIIYDIHSIWPALYGHWMALLALFCVHLNGRFRAYSKNFDLFQPHFTIDIWNQRTHRKWSLFLSSAAVDETISSWIFQWLRLFTQKRKIEMKPKYFELRPGLEWVYVIQSTVWFQLSIHLCHRLDWFGLLKCTTNDFSEKMRSDKF